MGATTTYGTWATVTGSSVTPEQVVADVIGSFGEDYDFEAACADYRQAVAAALPDGVVLSGEEFISPYADEDRTFPGYPQTEDGRLDLAAIVDGVDVGAILERHDHTLGGGGSNA